MDEIMAWVQAHRDQGHAADPTVVGAPGIGRGSWCEDCTWQRDHTAEREGY